MKKKGYVHRLLIIPLFLLVFNSILTTVRATDALYLNNVNNDFTIDGYTNVWYNTSSDQRDISVKYDSNIHRIVTGVRVHYRTARLLADYADCPATYKFESGSDWVDYNDDFPNTTGSDQVHMFNCQGDTFLITNTFFYISIGVGSDDPYIQVGADTDRSGHSEYSLNGGSWTLDTVEYLIEALVENVSILEEDTNLYGEITYNDDFVDAYNITLLANDDAHFNVKSNDPNEYFNMRFFPSNTKLTSNASAIWIENGTTPQKARHYVNNTSQDYILLVEPNTDGVDNATYMVNWTYNPNPPVINAPPPLDDDGNITLNWTAPIDSDLNYYNIYRSNSPNVPVNIAYRIATTITETNLTDAYLANGTYYYVITSVDNTGHESIASNEISTTIGDMIKPKTPNLKTPESFPVDYDGKILINWSLEDYNDVSSCNIYRSNIMNFQLNSSTFLINKPKISTTFEDQVIFNGIYYYIITAIDINGLESNSSNKVNTTYMDITPPQAPSDLEYEILNKNNVFLSWPKSIDIDFSHYKIYRASSLITKDNLNSLTPVKNITTTHFTDENLSPGTYYYVVIAVDLNGLESVFIRSYEVIVPEENYLYLLLAILIIIISVILFSLVIIHRKIKNLKSKTPKTPKALKPETKTDPVINKMVNKEKENLIWAESELDAESKIALVSEKPQVPKEQPFLPPKSSEIGVYCDSCHIPNSITREQFYHFTCKECGNSFFTIGYLCRNCNKIYRISRDHFIDLQEPETLHCYKCNGMAEILKSEE